MDVTFREGLVYGWGYLTVLVRSFVRGLQSASFGSGFRQITVSYIDKSKRNAPAYLFFRATKEEKGAKKIVDKNSKKGEEDNESYLKKIASRFNIK